MLTSSQLDVFASYTEIQFKHARGLIQEQVIMAPARKVLGPICKATVCMALTLVYWFLNTGVE